MRTGKILKYVAFVLMTLLGVLGGLFAAGYAVEDPGGWVAAAMIAAQVIPVVALVVLVFWRPTWAVPVLVVVAVLVVALNVAMSTFGVPDPDRVGPLGAVALLWLGFVLGFLALRRTTLAGLLLVVVGLAQLAAVAAALAQRGFGPGFGGSLFGSSGILVIPLLAIGVLFVVAGRLIHEPLLGVRTPRNVTQR